MTAITLTIKALVVFIKDVLTFRSPIYIHSIGDIISHNDEKFIIQDIIHSDTFGDTLIIFKRIE